MKCNLAELLIHCTRANKLEIHPKTLSTRIQIFLKMDIFFFVSVSRVHTKRRFRAPRTYNSK